MSTILLISTSPKIDGIGDSDAGYALSRVSSVEMMTICRAAGVPDPMSFYSEAPGELEEFLSDYGVNAGDAQTFDEAWYDPEAGLSAMRGLRQYLEANPQALNNSSAVVEGLKCFEADLQKLREVGAKWHFSLG